MSETNINWSETSQHKIHNLMYDYSADGYHYLPESKTLSKMNDKEREIGDFEPRV